jgi:SAM-dependent methyltransferase
MEWRVKVGIQFVLARLPYGTNFNHWLQLVNQSYTPQRVRDRVLLNAEIVGRIAKFAALRRATIVEVGTGWELIGPLILSLFEPDAIYTFDLRRHLRFNIVRKVLRQIEAEIDKICALCDLDCAAAKRQVRRMADAPTLNDVLALAKIVYIAPGDAARTGLPDGSLDLFFSREVMEHLTEPVLLDILRESKRLLKPSGVAFHAIEPGDHYANAKAGLSRVNFLQYSERSWNFWVSNKLSYHNRWRARQFLDTFTTEGARILDIRSQTDSRDVELLKNGFRLHPKFSGFTPEELAVNYLEVVHRFEPEQNRARGSVA